MKRERERELCSHTKFIPTAVYILLKNWRNSFGGYLHNVRTARQGERRKKRGEMDDRKRENNFEISTNTVF